MEEKLKERLFGALVIVALGVIFVPMLFDKPVPAEVDPGKPLPTQPNWAPEDMAVVAPEQMQAKGPDQSVIFEFDNTPAPHVALPPMPEMRTAAAVEPEPGPDTASETLSKTFSPKAWSVQLATFSDYQNAKRLENSLRKEGYPAYSIQSYNGEKVLTRVLVGPELEQAKAKQLVDALSTRFELKGIVVPYDPVAG